ncbi:MAG: site-specific integrase [Akkermansia sp.]|nr:site-specific integrase [Akkermansia sp.]
MAFLKKRGNKWYAAWYHNGKYIVKATGISIKGKKEEKLAQQAATAMEAAAKGNIQLSRALESVRAAAESLGMSESLPLIEDYFTNFSPASRDSNRSNYRRAVSLFLDFLGPMKIQKLDRLTPAMCRDFCVKRMQEVSFGTAKNNYALLKAALNQAVRDGILDRNPFCAFSIFSLAPSNIPRAIKRLPFSIEEMHTILTEFPVDWREIVFTSLITGGQRLGDICCLEWKHINLDQNIVMFNTQKTGKEIVVPIHPQLRNIIDAHANNGSEYLFPDAARKYIRWKGGMSVEFTTLLKAHNILRPEHVITTKAGRKISVKSFHSIRHTVVTLLRSSTLFTADITRGIVGHDSEEIERQYFTMSLDSKSVGLNYIFDVIQKGGEQ